MIAPFPAVIKDIRATPGEIILTLDIVPPDLSALTDLIDQEVTILMSAVPFLQSPPISAMAPLAAPAPSEKLPFEPDDPPVARSRRKPRPSRSRRPAKSRAKETPTSA